MINWVCSILASSFNAHLDEHEKKIKEAVEEARQKAQEFNSAMDKLKKLGADTSVTYTTWNSANWSAGKYFRIRRLDCSMSTRKDL